MGRNTNIGWCRHTANFWWGCKEVSPECALCYARVFAQDRLGHQIWGDHTTPRRMIKSVWENIVKWNDEARAEGVRHTVFTQSMSDMFEDHPALPEVRSRATAEMERLEWLAWLNLTKRPENVMSMVPNHWVTRQWPRHIWLGVTTGNQEQAALRLVRLLPLLDMSRPPIIFVSAEPLLGPIDFTRLPYLTKQRVAQLHRGIYNQQDAARLADEWQAIWAKYIGRCQPGQTFNVLEVGALDWIIAGGESGAKPRRMDLASMRGILDSCKRYNVDFFAKQLGEVWARKLKLSSRHGSDLSEWPAEFADFAVQQFPATTPLSVLTP